MDLPPKSVFTAFVLIGLNASFWLIYALIVGLGLISPFAAHPVLRWIMTSLALGASLCLILLTVRLYRRNRLAFYAGVAMLAGIAVLSILDDFGTADLIRLVTSLIALGLMLKDRAWYLNGKDPSSGEA